MNETSPLERSNGVSELLGQALKFAKAAGQEILAYYDADCGVTVKEDASPLTAADMASHLSITRDLRGVTPEIPIISEESTGIELEGHADAIEFWLVDPLDGTKEFLKRSGQFTVNIALVKNKRPILGVVHAPAMRLSYMAEAGKGAWRQERDDIPTPIRCGRADPAHLRLVASKDHAGPQVAAMLTKMSGANLVSMGSALKFCLVAEGKADLYPRFVGTMEWDTAAAQCVVEAAGGTITDMGGSPLTYNKPNWLNPAIITCGDRSLCWSSCL